MKHPVAEEQRCEESCTDCKPAKQCEKHSKKEEALTKLRDGAKFDDVAREFSEDKARQGRFSFLPSAISTFTFLPSSLLRHRVYLGPCQV